MPLKVRYFCWKARLNRIPCKVALAKRGVNVGSEECSMCVGHRETTDHCLSGSSFTLEIWRRIANWCGWTDLGVSNVRDRIDWFSNLPGSELQKEMVMMIIMATIWYSWLARNDLIFNAIPLSVERVIDKIKVNSFLWLKYRAKKMDIAWHIWASNPLVL